MNIIPHIAEERANRCERWAFWMLVVLMATLPFLFTMWPLPEGSKALYRGAAGLAVLLRIIAGGFRRWARSPGPSRGSRIWHLTKFLLTGFLAATTLYGIAFFAGGELSRISELPDFADWGSPEVRYFLYYHFFETHLYALLILFSLLVISPRGAERQAEGLWTYSLIALRGLIIAMFFVGLLSAFFSYEPNESMADFRDNLGSSVLVMLVLLDIVRRPAQIKTLLAASAYAGIYSALVCFLWLAIFHFSPNDYHRDYAVRGSHQLIYCTHWQNFKDEMAFEEMDIRPAFPLMHHNRLGNYMMMLVGIGAALILWPRAPRKDGKSHLKVRAFWAGATLLFFACLITSWSRGAWLCLFAGTGALIPLYYRPWRGWAHNIVMLLFLAAAIGGWSVLPEQQQRRIQQLFIWEDDLTKLDGNMVRRMKSVETAYNMWTAYPLRGIGYGFHVFEDMFKKYMPPPGKYPPEPQGSEVIQPHAHMNWMQVLAEQGVFGGALFIIFQFFVLGLIYIASLIAERQRSPLVLVMRTMLAIGLMMFAYGFTNYGLRFTMGLQFFILMTLTAIAAFSWHRMEDTQPNNLPPKEI